MSGHSTPGPGRSSTPDDLQRRPDEVERRIAAESSFNRGVASGAGCASLPLLLSVALMVLMAVLPVWRPRLRTGR